jgi:hypothetical protein
VLWSRAETGQAALWRITPDFTSGMMGIDGSAYLYSTGGIGGPWEATGFVR